MSSQRSTGAGRALANGLLASTMLAGSAFAAHAATTDANTVTEVIVTAQKQEESLQKVSLSIQALDTKTLTQRNVADFQDYVKYLPSVSFQTTAPSSTSIYMRGVASGENGNHSGPLPTVGLYLDEQSVTTIGGALDIHIYDVARIESLAGPQGTLYGASSESGTVRIITNKPSSAGFKAGYDVQASTGSAGDPGYTAEGFVNIPVNEKAAVRLVGWATHDGGYINNVAGTKTFSTGAVINNSALVKKNFNPVDTLGGRAALKVDLNDSWTVSPSILFQDQRQEGVFAYKADLGDLNVQRFAPDKAHDRFYQASLTVNGKLSKFDVTYTGGYFQRKLDTTSDYTDYSFWYDKAYGSAAYWTDSSGAPVSNPSQFIIGKDRFDKSSHEIRIASPKSDRLRFVAGAFTQRQSHWIIQDYTIKNLDPGLSVHKWPGTIWLTDQMRVDRDSAVFGQVSYDLTDQLTFTGGLRAYEYKNSLVGFFGFGSGFSSHTGEARCTTPSANFRGVPCINLNKTVSDNGSTYKFDLTYKISPEKLIYVTAANGYRPGGVNRNGNLPPYAADELKSYELGWKTTWAEKRFRLNGAVYYEDWSNFQYSFLGANSLTVIANAGAARILGIESDFAYVASPHLTFSGALAYTSAELSKPYCNDITAACPSTGNPVLAANGQQLPVTPPFKANLTARYTFNLSDWDAHAQASAVYSDSSWSDLRDSDRAALGALPSYTLVDLSFGAEKNDTSVELFVKNLFDERANLTRFVPCTTSVCGQGGPYIVPQRPLTIGVRVGQKF
jgi:outer membrane receptor protein involved in Fe transport